MQSKNSFSYSELFDNVKELVLIHDLSGKIRFINSHAEKLLGVKKDKLLGRQVGEFLSEAQRQEMRDRSYFRKLGNGDPYSYNLTIKNSDGKSHILDISSNLLSLEENEQLVLILGREIDRKGSAISQAEQRIDDLEFLSASASEFLSVFSEEALFEKMVNLLSRILPKAILVASSYNEDDAMMTIRTLKGIGRLQNKLLDLIGRHPVGLSIPLPAEGMEAYREKQIVKLPSDLAIITGGALSKPIARSLEKVLSAREFYGIGLKREGKLLGSLLIIIRNRQKPFNTQLVKAFVGQASIALYRINAEKHHRKSEERFKAFINSSSDLAFVKDDTFAHIAVNKAYLDFLGKEEAEVIGKTDFELLPQDLAQQCRLSDEKTLSAGESLTVENHAEAGKIYESRKFQVPLSNGRIGIGGLIRDVTEKKRTESRLLASLREKEILLREIHHRVKNNMQIISSLLNLAVKNEAVNPKAILEESKNRIRSMALIHEMLYGAENLSAINFCRYLDNLVGELFTSFNDMKESIKVDIECSGITVDINYAIPMGLLCNEIISNSFKHAFPNDRKGRILIRIFRERTIIKLRISDNGIGIPKEKDFASGSMGLLIIRSLIEQLSGTIQIERENGTNYLMEIPVHISNY